VGVQWVDARQQPLGPGVRFEGVEKRAVGTAPHRQWRAQTIIPAHHLPEDGQAPLELVEYSSGVCLSGIVDDAPPGNRKPTLLFLIAGFIRRGSIRGCPKSGAAPIVILFASGYRSAIGIVALRMLG